MKSKFYFFALLFVSIFVFTSCDTTPISVQSVSLTPSEISIAVGAPAVNLTATISPANATNRTLAWTSDNERVATVSNGTVFPVSAGTTTITVITVDGGRTATATVTVTPAPIAVTSVTLAGCNPDAPLAIGATRQLTATVLPENATNTAVTWSSNNTNVATVDVNSGLVTAVTAGTATITVTTADDGRTATCVITVVACNIDNPAGVVINGIRWATRNIDMPGTFAPHPESAGKFYQWGTLNGVVHHWAATGTVTGWNSNNPDRVAWTAANDPCPQGWRVPTQQQLQSLVNAGSVWTQRNGVNGRLFGTAPNQIFLPAAGRRTSSSGAFSLVGGNGAYWSSTQNGSAHAWGLWFGSVSNFVGSYNRAYGFSVRCVAE